MTGISFTVTKSTPNCTKITLQGNLQNADCLRDVEYLIQRLKLSGCSLFFLDCNDVNTISPGGLIAIFQILETCTGVNVHLLSNKRRHHNYFRSRGVSEHFPVSSSEETSYQNTSVVSSFNCNSAAVIVFNQTAEEKPSCWSRDSVAKLDIFGISLLGRNLETLRVMGVRHVVVVTNDTETANYVRKFANNLQQQSVTILNGNNTNAIEVLGGSTELRLASVNANRTYFIPADSLLLPHAISPYTATNFQNRRFEVVKEKSNKVCSQDTNFDTDVTKLLNSDFPIVVEGSTASISPENAVYDAFMEGSYIKIGSPSSYATALRQLFSNRLFLDQYSQVKENLWVGYDVDISKLQNIDAMGVIGNESKISPDACLLGINFIGPNCVIKDRALLRDCCMMGGVTICPGDFYDEQILLKDQTLSFERPTTEDANSDPDLQIGIPPSSDSSLIDALYKSRSA
ncbi:MAG: hypothetical protein AAF754_00515 [Pseudomonadota bacterium]